MEDEGWIWKWKMKVWYGSKDEGLFVGVYTRNNKPTTTVEGNINGDDDSGGGRKQLDGQGSPIHISMAL